MGQGSELSKETSVEESTSVKVNDRAPDKNMMLALTEADGPLGSGALPGMGNVSETGQKHLAEAVVSESTKTKKTPKPRETEKPAEEITPKGPRDLLTERKADVLKDATEARKYALSLKNLSYSGELVQGLMDFSKKMESAFEKINGLLADSGASDQRFNNMISYLDHHGAWYKNAEAGFYS